MKIQKEDKKTAGENERTFDYGTHPGAYTTDYDMNNVLLDTVDCTDDVFKNNVKQPKKRANPGSPSAPDPAVPNRAHTQI